MIDAAPTPIDAPVPAIIEVTPLLRIHKMTFEIDGTKYVSQFVQRQRAIDDSRMVYFRPSPKKQKPEFKHWLDNITVLVHGEDELPKLVEREVRASGSYRGARRNQARIAARMLKKQAKLEAREAKAAIEAVTA